MKISEILKKENILFDLDVENKFDIISKLVDNIARTNNLKDKDKIYQEVLKREKIMSTGVGKGIALPHAKTNLISQMHGAILILNNPVDFESLDSDPVYIVFMLIGSENNVGGHLRVLSKVSRLMSSDSFRSQLSNCTTPEEVLDLFTNYEDKM